MWSAKTFNSSNSTSSFCRHRPYNCCFAYSAISSL